jgi:hypothetical protein
MAGALCGPTRFISFVVVLLPLALFGDGKVFPPTAYPDVQIPDQRALIHFADGAETLVIETSFVGQGTNFAWVVPVPSVPKIEEASTGLFPTLQTIFHPKVIHDVTRYYLGLLIAGALVVMWRQLFGVEDMPQENKKPTNAAAESLRMYVRTNLASDTNLWHKNFLIGGLVREEDSPGNYTIRQTEEDFEYIWYDIDGAPQIIPLSEPRRTPKK